MRQQGERREGDSEGEGADGPSKAYSTMQPAPVAVCADSASVSCSTIHSSPAVGQEYLREVRCSALHRVVSTALLGLKKRESTHVTLKSSCSTTVSFESVYCSMPPVVLVAHAAVAVAVADPLRPPLADLDADAADCTEAADATSAAALSALATRPSAAADELAGGASVSAAER